MPLRPIDDEQYRRLLTLRIGLRRFLHWSEARADAIGITPAQHQLLLAVRGHGQPEGPTIGDVAGYLLLKHHSAGELVHRAEASGLVSRVADDADMRVVRLRLTPLGSKKLSALTRAHLEELSRLARHINPILRGLDTADTDA